MCNYNDLIQIYDYIFEPPFCVWGQLNDPASK